MAFVIHKTNKLVDYLVLISIHLLMSTSIDVLKMEKLDTCSSEKSCTDHHAHLGNPCVSLATASVGLLYQRE